MSNILGQAGQNGPYEYSSSWPVIPSMVTGDLGFRSQNLFDHILLNWLNLDTLRPQPCHRTVYFGLPALDFQRD
jgi:hypothetical protein